uniref:RNA-directed DNA polymerase n=1 Tax=Ixodes ricinus TaxID=34613 RepID=A0A6B0UUU1_IXORI
MSNPSMSLKTLQDKKKGASPLPTQYKTGYCIVVTMTPTVRPLFSKHLRTDILCSLHNDPTAGHMGFFKTCMRVRNNFYWQGMYRGIFKYVSSGLQCQRRKRPTTAGLLHPLEPPHYPFGRVRTDLLVSFLPPTQATAGSLS